MSCDLQRNCTSLKCYTIDDELCGPIYSIVAMNVIGAFILLINIGHIVMLNNITGLLKTNHGHTVLRWGLWLRSGGLTSRCAIFTAWTAGSPAQDISGRDLLPVSVLYYLFSTRQLTKTMTCGFCFFYT